jgi:hypothetical protein
MKKQRDDVDLSRESSGWIQELSGLSAVIMTAFTP